MDETKYILIKSREEIEDIRDRNGDINELSFPSDMFEYCSCIIGVYSIRGNRYDTNTGWTFNNEMIKEKYDYNPGEVTIYYKLWDSKKKIFINSDGSFTSKDMVKTFLITSNLDTLSDKDLCLVEDMEIDKLLKRFKLKLKEFKELVNRNI